MGRRARILIIVGSGGGGHKATARALTEACRQARKDFEMEIVDASQILGISVSVGDGIYNWLMSSGRAQWVPALHSLGHHLTAFNEPTLVQLFRSYLSKQHWDMVVCCTPHINAPIAEALSSFKPSPPLVTLMSDFENSVDHPWMQDHRQYIICGTENAIKQTIALGHPRDRVYGTSGMIVHPSFYRPLGYPVEEGLTRLGLRPGWRTICIFFGGFAPNFLPHIVNLLLAMEEPFNLIVMCGKNLGNLAESLASTLPPKVDLDDGDDEGEDDARSASGEPSAPSAERVNGSADAVVSESASASVAPSASEGTKLAADEPSTASTAKPKKREPMDEFGPWSTYGDDRKRVHLVGYTERVPLYMRLSDVLIGKPGPGVISEAIVTGLPVIVEVNKEHTLPQEQAVADWIRHMGVGVVVSSFDELPQALDPEQLSKCAERTSIVRNNAVFEVPHILEGILKLSATRHRRIQSATNPTEAGVRPLDTARSSPNLLPDNVRAHISATTSMTSDLDLSARADRALSLNDRPPSAISADAVEAPTASSALTSPIVASRPPLLGSVAAAASRGGSGSDGASTGDTPGSSSPRSVEGGDVVVTKPPNGVPRVLAKAEDDSVSINSSSYSGPRAVRRLDTSRLFEEPIRLDEYDLPQMRILINASGRWGHDVICFSVGFASDPDTIEFSFSSGYKVTWFKELIISSNGEQLARMVTKNADHGPHTAVIPVSALRSPVLKLEFYKAGMFGIRTHGYTRYLDANWCVGHAITLLWSRERYALHDRT